MRYATLPGTRHLSEPAYDHLKYFVMKWKELLGFWSPDMATLSLV